VTPGLGDEPRADALQLRAGEAGLGQLHHHLVTEVQALSRGERLEGNAPQQHVLFEDSSEEPEELELGLVHQQELPPMAGRAGGVPVAQEAALGLGDGALHRPHRLTARAREPERPHYASGHRDGTSIRGCSGAMRDEGTSAPRHPSPFRRAQDRTGA
jgi:hypothetical protein